MRGGLSQLIGTLVCTTNFTARIEKGEESMAAREGVGVGLITQGKIFLSSYIIVATIPQTYLNFYLTDVN